MVLYRYVVSYWPQGIRGIYNYSIFLYMFCCIGIIALGLRILKGPEQWKRKRPQDAYDL